MNHGFEPRETHQIVILDNRDSFVFNLAHRIGEVGPRPAVVRSDEIELDELMSLQPAALVVSPGPGGPADAGVSVDAIRRFAGAIPILGVCLGHQAVAAAFEGRIERSERPVHGMATRIDHDTLGIFAGLPDRFEAARYHSLVVTDVPDEFVVSATGDGFVMGIRHRRWPVYGVQFHPESVLTGVGRELLRNFCCLVG